MPDIPAAVVFDLDGTLVETAPDLAAVLNELLGEQGRPGQDVAAVRTMIGDGARALIQRGFDASGGLPDGVSLDDLFACFLERYGAAPCRASTIFDGVIDALEVLAARDIRLGVCTNKPHGPTGGLLRALDLHRYFASIIGGDSLPVRKPDPEHLLAVLRELGVPPAGSVMVGDSHNDVATARAAGVPCILVSFGYTSVPARELGADVVIDSFHELVPALARLRRAPALASA